MRLGYLNCVGSSARRKLTAAIMAIVSGAVHAAPQGGNVVAGSADLEIGDAEYNVHQHSDRVVIEYDEFNVDASETVNFFQPDANSVALNRVIGNNLSDIHGQINANGQVFLINPNGVVFGQGAQVDVGALVVSTLDIQNQDFMAGHHQFNGDANGRIEIEGNVRVDGRAAFIAPHIRNKANVTANEVVFYSGSDVYVPVEGSRIPVLVDEFSSGAVENYGEIAAERVVMAVAGAKESLLRNDGLIRATSLSGDGGIVELIAPQSDVVNVGTVDASATADISATAGHGGRISVETNRFAQVGLMSADGANDGGGGSINLHAEDTMVLHDNSHLSVDGGERGDGGEIIALAENATWYQEGSSISARGGGLAGDGGFVEVSGRKLVSIETVVDVRAPSGEDGLWYIDPTDISISNGANSNGSYAASGSDYIWQLSGAPSASIVNGLALQNQLVNFGNVEIDTASAAGASGNITFDYLLDFNGIPGGRTLTLRADSNISFQSGSSIFDSDLSSANGLNLVLVAGGDLLYQSNSSTALGTGVYSASIGANVTMFSSTLIAGAGDTTLDVGGIFSMNSGAEVNVASRFTVSAGSNIQLAQVTSASTADDAIRLTTTGGPIIDDGDNATLVEAPSGGIFLQASTGMSGLDLNTDTLGLRNTDSGNVTINRTGDLTLTSLYVGDNINMSVTTDGNITYNGSSNADLDGSVGGQISLTSTAGSIALNSALTDSTGSIDHDVDLVFDAATSFSVADGYQISSGTGTLSVTANNGDANVTGLYSLSNAFNAVTVNAPNGQITDGGSFADDIGVPVGGFVLNANGNISDIETNSNFFDVVSTTGDISLNENMSFTALRLQAAGAVTLASGGEFVLPDAAPFSATDLSVTAGSIIRLPDAALSLTGDLFLSGTDITDQSNSRALDFSASTLTIASGLTGGDLALSTDVNTLLLNNSGTNSLDITEADAVVVNQLDGTGNISLGLTTGSASFGTSTLNHSGLFSLTTAGAGQWIVPDAGLSTNGDLLVDVAEILDSDSTVILSASDANLSIRTGASATNIQSSFDSASIDYQGSTAFSLNDSDGLQLNALITGGNASISTTDADLSLTASPTVSGDLSLQALNSGDVIVPAAGLTHSNNLNLVADAISDGDNTVSLGASNADITLRNNPASIQINSTFTQLDIDYQGGTDLTVIDTDALVVNSVNAAGVLSLSSTDGDLQLNSAPTGASTLNLSAVNSGDVLIPSAGLSYSGDLSFLADNISDGDQDLTLAADNLQIQLRDGAADSTFNTTVNNLDFTSAGTGLVSIVESDALQVDGFSTAGAASIETTNAGLSFSVDPSVAGDLSLQTNTSGDVILAAAGLSHAANLSIVADALSDGDSTVSLSASNADLTLRNSATDTTLNTGFDQLDLDYQGGSNIAVIDSDALVINSLNADADVVISSSSADLTLSSSPTVAGVLSLSALTLGDLLIPAAGLTHTGDLNLLADNISDGDQDLTLAADNLQIQLRDGVAGSTYNTTVNNLDFTSAGTGLVSIVESDALQVDGFSTAGAASIEITNGDLNFTIDPSVAGDLSLQTNTSGDVILAAAGLSHTANLSIVADALNDGDNTLSLSASNADLTLRNSVTDTTLNTSFDQLDLDYQGGSNVTVTDSDALVLNSLNADADAAINSSSADLTLSNSPTVAGVLSLSTLTLGDLLIPATGLAHTGDLNLLADNISDGDQNLTLAADNLQIQLRDGAADSTFNTSINSLDLNNAGAGTVSVLDGDGLLVNSFATAGDALLSANGADLLIAAQPTVPGVLTLQTTGSGNLQIPTTGLAQAGSLTILADAIADDDSNVNLAATSADITLRNHLSDATVNSGFDVLDLDVSGGGSITVIDDDALQLNTIVADGAASFSANNADLTLLANPTVSGVLSLQTAGAGDVLLPAAGLTTSGDLIVTADALSDGDNNVSLGANSAAITLRNSAADTQINSSFAQLALDYQGISQVSVVDADDLAITALSAAGAAAITSNGDLDMSAIAPANNVAGNLNLATSGAGDLIINAAGLSHAGTLNISSNTLRDDDASVILTAQDAVLNLTSASNLSIDSQFTSLDITAGGPANITVNEADALDLLAASVDGIFNLNTADDLNIANAIDLDGMDLFSLQSQGDLSIAADIQDASGAVDNNTAITLSAQNNLTINDGIIVDAGTGSIAVNATTGNATVTGLRTASALADAVSVTAGGAILDGGDSVRDIRAGDGLNNGSVILDAQQGIAGLETAAADFQIRNGDASDVVITDNSNIRIEELNTLGYAELNAGGALRFYPGATVVASDLLAQATNMRLSDEGLSVPGLMELRAASSIENAESGGDIVLTADELVLDVDNSIAPLNFRTQTSALTLNYNGSDSLQLLNNSDLVLNAFSYSGGGDVQLESGTDFDFTVVGPMDLSGAGAANLSLVSGADLNIQNTLDNRAAGEDNTGDIALSALADFSMGAGGSVHGGAGRLTIDAAGTATIADLQTNNNANEAISLTANRITQLNPSLPSLQAGNGGVSLSGVFIGDQASPVLMDVGQLSIQGQDPNASAFINNLSSLQLEALSGLDVFALSIVNAGDLAIVPSLLDVSSALSLDVSNGSVVLSDAGLQTPGNLVIAASDIRDSDTSLSLSASAADLTFSAMSAATTLNTQFDSLDINAQGADITVNDVDALTLGSLSASDNASVQSNGADLDVSNANIDVTGDLNFATVGSGDVILASSGLSHNGSLTILADRIVDTDGNVQLAADTAQVQLRAHSTNATWQTDFNQLDLDLLGAGELVIINAGDLNINNLNSGSPVELRSAGNLNVVALGDAADLSLITLGSGEVILPDTGASINGNWFIDAAELSASDAQSAAQIAGLSANINIRNGNQNTQLLTDLAELSINFGGASDLSVQSSSDLLVSSLNSGGAVRLESLSSLGLGFATSAISDLSMAAPSGQIQLSDQGLTNTGSLTITAQDLVQSQSTSLGLSASTLDVALSAPAGDHSWQIATDALSVALGGDASLNITSSRTLELRDLSSQTGTAGEAISVSNGNFSLRQNAGDLLVSDRIRVLDQSADNVLAGSVDIVNTAGGIQVDAGITSDRSQEPAAEGALGIELALQNNEAGQSDIVLNDNLTALGGDILLDAGLGDVQQNTGAEISAYNNLGDGLDGEVEINGRVVEASAGQFIRLGRKLTIIDGRSLPPLEPELDPDEANDSVDDGADINRPIDEDSEATKSASLVYELAFGRCDELDESDSNRCRIDAALKAFLSHWLVGGEMPPKSEIRK